MGPHAGVGYPGVALLPEIPHPTGGFSLFEVSSRGRTSTQLSQGFPTQLLGGPDQSDYQQLLHYLKTDPACGGAPPTQLYDFPCGSSA